MNWDKIKNWKLLTGSHEFPGPSGGTCVNEAAIVAAGLEYREVTYHGDLPDCFCPVLGQLALFTNDCTRVSDEARTMALMPLVVGLAGSRVDDGQMLERAQRLGVKFFEQELRLILNLVTRAGKTFHVETRNAEAVLSSLDEDGLRETLLHVFDEAERIADEIISLQVRVGPIADVWTETDVNYWRAVFRDARAKIVQLIDGDFHERTPYQLEDALNPIILLVDRVFQALRPARLAVAIHVLDVKELFHKRAELLIAELAPPLDEVIELAAQRLETRRAELAEVT